MTTSLEWMETPNGKRFRFWSNSGDGYCGEEMTAEEAAAELVRWAQGRMTPEQAAESIAARTDEEHRVEKWAGPQHCPDCGGWNGTGERCYTDGRRCGYG